GNFSQKREDNAIREETSNLLETLKKKAVFNASKYIESDDGSDDEKKERIMIIDNISRHEEKQPEVMQPEKTMTRTQTLPPSEFTQTKMKYDKEPSYSHEESRAQQALSKSGKLSNERRFPEENKQ